VHHAAFLGTSSSTTPLTTVASTLGRLAPALLVLLKSDAHADELERRLMECAKFAEVLIVVSPRDRSTRSPTPGESRQGSPGCS
jgi:hypothetical protein